MHKKWTWPTQGCCSKSNKIISITIFIYKLWISTCWHILPIHIWWMNKMSDMFLIFFITIEIMCEVRYTIKFLMILLWVYPYRQSPDIMFCCIIANQVRFLSAAVAFTEKRLHCVRGAQGVVRGEEITASQLDLPSLTPLSATGWV